MMCAKRTRIAAPGLVLAAMSLAVPANATTPAHAGGRSIVLAQAMIPRTGMMDAQNPMPMKERYLKRFRQPARVGDLRTPVEEIKRASDAFGLDFNFMKTVAKIESDFEPKQRTGSYIGLFQLSNYEFAKELFAKVGDGVKG